MSSEDMLKQAEKRAQDARVAQMHAIAVINSAVASTGPRAPSSSSFSGVSSRFGSEGTFQARTGYVGNPTTTTSMRSSVSSWASVAAGVAPAAPRVPSAYPSAYMAPPPPPPPPPPSLRQQYHGHNGNQPPPSLSSQHSSQLHHYQPLQPHVPHVHTYQALAPVPVAASMPARPGIPPSKYAPPPLSTVSNGTNTHTSNYSTTTSSSSSGSSGCGIYGPTSSHRIPSPQPSPLSNASPRMSGKRSRSTFDFGTSDSGIYGPAPIMEDAPAKKSKAEKKAEKKLAAQQRRLEKQQQQNENKKKGKKAAEYSSASTSGSSIYGDHFAPTAQDLALRGSRAARFQREAHELKGKVTLHTITSSDKVNVRHSLTTQDGRPLSEQELAALRIVGTCTVLEKPYLRLTTAPDPASVRPPKVLKQWLRQLKERWHKALGRRMEDKDAFAEAVAYMRSQLKAIRQDLVVQHVQGELTVDVYETHARVALQSKDFKEFSQCEAQLRGLYAKGLGTLGHQDEFWGYRILFVVCRQSSQDDGFAEMTHLMQQLLHASGNGPAVTHAMQVRLAVQEHRYHLLLTQLVPSAPNFGRCILNPMLEEWRFAALQRIVKAHAPVPMSRNAVLCQLGYDTDRMDSRKRGGRYLRLAGCVCIGSGDATMLDTKASVVTPFKDEEAAHELFNFY